ncbi:hypothetical protein CYMTET_19817 [Cymbomonas tetramitiformis]|uniref:Uncharacterized protein n=1 Tax=Cymbomonas tetramitiformis TaxID=36881 RepID=A0AAE0G5D7_9CHLO|nr:hypothetical protein CYMTET_19817 [Cymbomonas tetramitiformis]
MGGYENDMYAEQFQASLEGDDSERFDALCFLAGGKPEMCDVMSAFSFGITEDRAPGAIGEYAARNTSVYVDASVGGFTVGGVAGEVAIFTTMTIDDDAPSTLPRATVERADSEDAGMHPVAALKCRLCGSTSSATGPLRT